MRAAPSFTAESDEWRGEYSLLDPQICCRTNYMALSARFLVGNDVSGVTPYAPRRTAE